jgi:uncharacterized protein YcsI (UPF0317 family)
MSDRVLAESGLEVRLAARSGFCGLTVGRAPGHVQANLVLLPSEFADDFEAFCRANAQACPLLAVGAPGSWRLPRLGVDLDLRTDLPSYLIAESGKERHTHEIDSIWRDDLVAFAIGCWFSAEAALRAAGIRLRHVELGVQGPLFRTNRDAVARGHFSGPLVVSMRPFARADVGRVREITSRLRLSHGAPVHEGSAAELGIVDINRPDWGEPLSAEDGEVPLFWACGLTALAALKNSQLPFFITHAPGAMLVTDVKEALTI